MAGTDQQAWRIRQVIDGCRDAFIEFDGDCAIIEWGRRAEQLLGWTREEMVGRTLFDCVADRHVEAIEQGMAVLRSWGAGVKPEALPTGARPLVLEIELRHRSGETVAATGSVFATGTAPELRIGVFVQEARTGEEGHHGEGHGAPQIRDRLHDPLTGLPNRMLFIQRLATAIAALREAGGSVAVVAFGLDRFKAINDAMGHEAGDDLLVAVASRLRLAGGSVRPILARLGGDEFLALFEQPGGVAGRDAEVYAARVLSAMGEPFDIGGREIFLSASAGIASTADHGTEASMFLADAEAAMHEGKGGGGGGMRVFGEAMRRQVVERLHTELDLHRALDRGELTLHYQPVVDIAGSGTVGMEALLRWCHPEHGLMGPDHFIPVAEESGLIIPIGAWVMAEACSQLQRWHQDGGMASGTVEVNLSARQVDHPDLMATVEEVLETTGLPPEHLTLEITESALMRDADSAMGVLGALKRTGVSLAVDDFGTGYCSLSYLHRFPLDILKIDKAFVDELDDGEGTEIVAAVVDLAHALGLDVVAEGVETERQLAILRQLGCDHAQGYLFSRPVPPSGLGHPFGDDVPWARLPGVLGSVADGLPESAALAARGVGPGGRI
ncbi:MAG: putative bifunctional diguanylate cyclase/phosphodiesterase [Acidimicrobiales bacterium]